MTILSVADYLKLVNETLALMPSEEIAVEGEVSDYRLSQGKWINFSLKDADGDATLPCFATTFQFSGTLEDGMRVRAFGYARVFERFGKFSLNVRAVEPVGEGALRKTYEALKKKLEAEGLFDVARKRSLPRFVSHVGIITSKEAAAYTDFLRIAKNRWGAASIELYPVHVQGREAVGDILEAFRYFNALALENRPEAVVLTRGGGSLEDLHAFNDEAVARAVFGSLVPVVCGVGHERDESLCDFVADVRASTPSNAAERIFPDRASVLYEIAAMADAMESRERRLIEEHGATVRHAGGAMGQFFERLGAALREREMRIAHRFLSARQTATERLRRFSQVLAQVDPKRVLSRGYSIVRLGQKVVSRASELELGASVRVQLARGSFSASVISTDV